MLRLRARSWALRDQFPDALRGLMMAEEAREIPVEVEVVADEAPQELPPPPAKKRGTESLKQTVNKASDAPEDAEKPPGDLGTFTFAYDACTDEAAVISVGKNVAAHSWENPSDLERLRLDHDRALKRVRGGKK